MLKPTYSFIVRIPDLLCNNNHLCTAIGNNNNENNDTDFFQCLTSVLRWQGLKAWQCCIWRRKQFGNEDIRATTTFTCLLEKLMPTSIFFANTGDYSSTFFETRRDDHTAMTRFEMKLRSPYSMKSV